MKPTETETRKVTLHLPAKLLEDVMALSGAGITETVREALQSYGHSRACEELRKLRGKVRLDIDLDELRKDKER